MGSLEVPRRTLRKFLVVPSIYRQSCLRSSPETIVFLMQIMSRRGAHLQKDYIQSVVGGGDDERMVTGRALIQLRLAQENLGPRLRGNRSGMVVRFPEST